MDAQTRNFAEITMSQDKNVAIAQALLEGIGGGKDPANCGFHTVTNLNDFKDPTQTTNLVLASLSCRHVRATHLQHGTSNPVVLLPLERFPKP